MRDGIEVKVDKIIRLYDQPLKPKEVKECNFYLPEKYKSLEFLVDLVFCLDRSSTESITNEIKKGVYYQSPDEEGSYTNPGLFGILNNEYIFKEKGDTGFLENKWKITISFPLKDLPKDIPRENLNTHYYYKNVKKRGTQKHLDKHLLYRLKIQED